MSFSQDESTGPVKEINRVRRHTSPSVLARIDQQIEDSVRFHSTQSPATVSQRIRELDAEWSIERWLETNASALVFAGTMLGITVNKKFLAIPLVVSGFLFQHAIQGWCPPMPVLRRKGIRTREEIDQEKYALKVIRGDFKNLNENLAGQIAYIKELIAAVKAC